MILEQRWRDALNDRLAELGWSRSEFARRLGVSPQYVTNYLNGRNQPGSDVMEHWAATCGLEIDMTFHVRQTA